MIRAAISTRVSTGDQLCTLQIRELTEYVERRGWNLASTYQDQISGAKASRPGLDRLMQDARQRKFDTVLVWKLDRFGRSLVNCINGIQELSSLGVRFIAVSQGLDTDQSSPTSTLLLHILGAVAQFERELIRERVSAGLKAAKARGTHSGNAIGRPKVIFDRAKVVEMRDGGRSWREIASALNVGVGTVRRVYASRKSIPVPKPCASEHTASNDVKMLSAAG